VTWRATSARAYRQEVKEAWDGMKEEDQEARQAKKKKKVGRCRLTPG